MSRSTSNRSNTQGTIRFLNYYQARNGFIYINLTGDLYFQLTLEQVQHLYYGENWPRSLCIDPENYSQSDFDRAYGVG